MRSAPIVFILLLACASVAPEVTEHVIEVQPAPPSKPGPSGIVECPQEPWGFPEQCPAVYRPACGLPSVDAKPSEGRTFANGCRACQEPTVRGYMDGACGFRAPIAAPPGAIPPPEVKGAVPLPTPER